jgi:hypothetical protein
MSHTERIGQLVHEHHYRMLACATQRQSRLGRQRCDLAGTARRAQRAERPVTRSLTRGRAVSLVKLTALASRQSRPGGAP